MSRDRLWVALAPTGVWSSGPAVCWDEQTMEAYKDMGWTIEGPYVLEPRLTDEQRRALHPDDPRVLF